MIARARWLWAAGAVLAVAVGAWQRAAAVRQLPPDYDELIYVPVAYDYRERMSAGRWGEIAHYAENTEHPPLVKLMFAAQLAGSGAPEPDWDTLDVGRPTPEDAKPALHGPRWLSWVFGVGQLAALAAVHPLAALELGLSTYHAKYTAQAYLEAVPGLFAILAVLLFERGLRRGPRATWALVGSAACLGLAAAGKYPYGLVVGLALLPFIVRDLRGRWGTWAAFAGVVLVSFFAAHPYLWPDPPGRLWDSVFFHWGYSRSEHVVKSALPWFQPLYWLTHAEPFSWHRGLFFTRVADWLLLPLAAVGFWRTWKTRPVWAVWAAVGLVFLFVWPTKWPQYTLLILPALALCAANGLVIAARPLAPVAARLGWKRPV